MLNALMFDIEPTAKAEWHPLREIMIHEPGIEVLYALFSPKEHLYEGPISFSRNSGNVGLSEQHRNLMDTYKSEGVRIHRLKELVLANPRARQEAKTILMKSLQKGYSRSNLYTPEERESIKSHADKVVEGLPPEYLWQLLVTNPELSDNYQTTNHKDQRHNAPKIELQVAGNLFYMRDQQFTTDRGVVMG